MVTAAKCGGEGTGASAVPNMQVPEIAWMRCIYALCALTCAVRPVLCSEMVQVCVIAGESFKCQKIVHWGRRKFDTEGYSLFRVMVLKKRAKCRFARGRGACAVKRFSDFVMGSGGGEAGVVYNKSYKFKAKMRLFLNFF